MDATFTPQKQGAMGALEIWRSDKLGEQSGAFDSEVVLDRPHCKIFGKRNPQRNDVVKDSCDQ